jgi:GT2 family glycosyltransferase
LEPDKPVTTHSNQEIVKVIEALEIGDELFREPTRLVYPYAWEGHICAAFWLAKTVKPALFVELGTQSGNSYGAFCQGIVESGLACRAYAVDTWKGDDHAGFYGEEVFADLNAFNGRHYGQFSTLVRSTFEEARPYFADDSIDLLHIDGLHTYEAVKHDFETWQSTLSEKGVVIFHDTNVRQNGFGVWKLWAELASRYPSFEFDHSHGLGILGVGTRQPEPLKQLFELGLDPTLRAVICRLFALRADGFLTRIRFEKLETEADGLRRVLASKDQTLVERDEALENFGNVVRGEDDEIRVLRGLIAQRDEALQVQKGRLLEREEMIQTQTALLRENQEAAARQHLTDQRRADELERQIRLIKAEEAAARLHLAAVYERSTSWRVTSPIRRLSVASQRLRERWRRRNDGSTSAAMEGSSVGETVSDPNVETDSKAAIRAQFRSRLQAFLASPQTLRLPSGDRADVSILLILHNQAELTFGCLASIEECLTGSNVAVEVIVLDNNSTDLTAELLSRVSGAKILRLSENLHFLRGVNRAAREATGRHLLLLNNDAQLLPGAVEAAVRILDSDETVGGVGGRIILPDGTLQEAGSIIWSDGTCSGYGRGGEPTAPEFMYRREVDYCSAACIMTPRAVFERFGGFDERYVPAYYEEVDYCVRLWASGLRIVFDPDVVVRHYEFGSASAGPALELQQRNHHIFQERHAEWLSGKASYSPQHTMSARSPRSEAKRVLVVEDRVPHAELGTGYPRTKLMVQELLAAGADVTFYPTLGPHEEWPDVRRSLDPSVEVMLGGSRDALAGFLYQRPGYYDGIVVCRPHNMHAFVSAVGADRRPIDGAFVAYDAEAIFSRRSRLQDQINGKDISSANIGQLVASEIRLTEAADAVISVSPIESRVFQECGVARTFLLGHAIDVDPTTTPFEEREGFIFLGAIQSDDSPNADSLRWFAERVLPQLRRELGAHIRPTVVGLNRAATVEALNGDAYDLVGMRDDLRPWFEKARVMIAPTRFAAGIPLKVYQAASLGVPVVATELVARQAGWQTDRDLLAASEADRFADACIRVYRDKRLWESLRESAIERCRQDCSPNKFRDGVRQILDAIPNRRNSVAIS